MPGWQALTGFALSVKSNRKLLAGSTIELGAGIGSLSQPAIINVPLPHGYSLPMELASALYYADINPK